MDERTAFKRGYEEQLKAKGFLDNPYEQDSDDFRVWIDGYVESMKDQRGRMGVPKCATFGCSNCVESSEDYCTDCLDQGVHSAEGKS